MKRLFLLSVLVITAFAIVSCNGDNGTNEQSSLTDGEQTNLTTSYHYPSVETLKGTAWKLVGIVEEIGSDLLKELEPRDCERCYTLTFDITESSNSELVFYTFSSMNSGKGTYEAKYLPPHIEITGYAGTEINERGDGYLWMDCFQKINAFSLEENELKLYYNEGKGYLLFKTLEI